MLYVPAVAGLPETFVRLDHIRPQPLHSFLAGQRKRLFSLSQGAFYILLIKLAIHFTRIQERVNRSIGGQGGGGAAPDGAQTEMA